MFDFCTKRFLLKKCIEWYIYFSPKNNTGFSKFWGSTKKNKIFSVSLKDRLLIEKGANVNAKNKYGITPLLELCKSYRTDKLMLRIVRILIGSGADVNAVDDYRKSPLHFLCENEKNDNLKDIFKLLIEKGADVNAKNYLSSSI